MTIRIQGSNWDVDMLRALAGHPPPQAGVEERHLHALRLLVDVIGDDLRVFLQRHGAKYFNRWRHPSDPVAVLASWMAEYFLYLHDVMQIGPQAITNWTDAIRAARALGETARLVVAMQLGYTLLLPLLVEEATGRAAYPVVHDQNPAVLAMYHERLKLGRPFVLNAISSSDIRQWLDSDGIVIANIDTSYPGTRHVRPLPFLDGRLNVPVGLLSLAVRRSVDVRAMAAPGAGGHVDLKVSPPLPIDIDGALREFGTCFERWVTAHPEQWMAWASLEEAC